MRTLLVALLSLWMSKAPLSAEFLPTQPSDQSRQLHYSLNDRAYVAIFVILPGHGVALLYPFNEQVSPESPGDHGVPLESASIRHEQRVDALLSNGDSADKTYLLLVASRQPLRLAPYIKRQQALDSAIAPEIRRSSSADAVVTGLVNLIAKPATADDFAYDLDLTQSVIPPRRLTSR
jgi:hypothetical protein